ncbi:MAG: hypothetical protein KIT83_22050, partial [Bryobacterales bacterium]|nr:hypothetical protein [Bryobacterales bacterium]
RRLETYDESKRFSHSGHIRANIFYVLERTFPTRQFTTFAKERIAHYLVLDALIGNTDRHHENWGILRHRTSDGWRGRVAPTFDHASSLGRELIDEGTERSRMRLLADGRVADYAEKAHGAVYWDSSARRAPSPLELVRRASTTYPELFHKALLQVAKLEEETFHRIVNRVPPDWMSAIARSFVIELLCYNLKQLKEIVP